MNLPPGRLKSIIPIADLASLVLDVAEVKPYKKRRLKVLTRERRDLLEALERTGLIHVHPW